MTDTLYETDFVTWTERQAHALRDAAARGSNLPLDWENLAEEIEDVGKSVTSRVRSLTRVIQTHLLKLACSTSTELHSHWMAEVDEFRVQLEQELQDNRALKARHAELAEQEFERAVRAARRSFERHGETAALTLLARWRHRGITAEQVVQDGSFPEPGTTSFRPEAS